MTRTAPADVDVFFDSESLAHGTAGWLTGRARAGLTKREPFAICLSGGSTPKRLYECLAEPDIIARFPWPRAHWFWGDERFVPHDHPDSNFGMARKALLSRAPIPAANIHPIPTEGLSPEQAAAAYEETLREFYRVHALPAGQPLFGVTLLGIGEDGHTASLFPGHPALEEKDRWVLAVTGAKPEPRITLTYPALDNSRHCVILATGAAKRAIVARARAGDPALPAARIKPVGRGRLHWFLDRAAFTGRRAATKREEGEHGAGRR